jgi:hypothetical protein
VEIRVYEHEHEGVQETTGDKLHEVRERTDGRHIEGPLTGPGGERKLAAEQYRRRRECNEGVCVQLN